MNQSGVKTNEKSVKLTELMQASHDLCRCIPLNTSSHQKLAKMILEQVDR
jgi:hypothetical protein